MSSAEPSPHDRPTLAPGLALRDGATDFAPNAEALAPWVERLRRLTAQPPAWLDLEAAVVPADRLRAVPVGPTLVIGMGGSALGTRATAAVAAAAGDLPHELRVLDTVDPVRVREDLDWASARGAGVQVISKSGSTAEVAALLDVVLARGLGPHVLISDPGARPFDARVAAAGCEPLRLDIPPGVGGRYSVFTAVGQAPLAGVGLAPDRLLDGARATARGWSAAPERDAAALLAFLAHRARFPAAAHVVWSYSEDLVPWASWLQQLECESLGRRSTEGATGELVAVLRGPADQHSVAQLLLDGPADKRITFVDYAGPGVAEDDALAPLARLRIASRDAAFGAMTLPAARLLLAERSLAGLGALMLHAMAWTVLTAEGLGVDPYGQPAVEAIKRRVKAALAPGRDP